MNGTIRNNLQWNLNQNTKLFCQQISFENIFCKMITIVSQPQCVKHCHMKRFRMSFHPGDHYWNYYPGAQSLNQVSATHLKKSTGARSSNELQRLHYMTGYQDSSPNNARIILWMRPANKRWRYIVTSSLIGWAHTMAARRPVLFITPII